MTKSDKNTEINYINYYSDLYEFPLFNWMKCNEGQIIYVRKEITPESEVSQLDEEIWEALYDQYIQKYGLSKLYKKMIAIMKEKALLECTFVMTRDRFKLTQIEIKEEELRSAMANNGNGMTIDQALIYLSKWIGYRLNPKEITVVEYFNILNEYGKANKKN